MNNLHAQRLPSYHAVFANKIQNSSLTQTTRNCIHKNYIINQSTHWISHSDSRANEKFHLWLRLNPYYQLRPTENM